ncbi:MAG: hypothetical protein K2H35_07080 [Muribaculaceae bacterium]|nr:hypothetical protein [Muribaculaceae bacterium]
MKKILTALFGVFALTASQADAATVYFENTANWDEVYAYTWAPNDAAPFGQLQSTEIDGHTLYAKETTKTGGIIFLNKSSWTDQKQTADQKIVDGAVYNAESPKDSEPIAFIKDGKYVVNEEYNPPVSTGTDIYLRGTMNNWGTDAAYEFAASDTENIYTLTVTLTKGTEFKIADSGWKLNYGGGLDITPGQTYTLVSGSNDNLTAAEDFADVVLTFNKADGTLAVSENGGEMPEINWYCAWNTGAGWTFGHQFEKQVEGTYKVTVTAPEGSAENYFAVFQGFGNTGWNDGTRYTPLNQEDVTVTEEGTYKMQVGSDGAWVLESNGTYTVVIDPRDQAESTISFDWGNSTGEANVLINEAGDEDHSFKSFAMTEVEGEDDDYSWTGTLKQGDELKFNIHGVNYYYDPSIGSISEDHTNGNLVIEYPLEEGDGIVVFDYTSPLTLVVNVTKKTVTATLTDPAPATINITVDGNSEIHRMNLVAGSEDEYKTTHPINFTTGSCVDFRIGATRYNPVFTIVPAAEGDAEVVEFTLVEANDTDAAPEWKGSTPGTPVMVTINGKTLTGTVGPDVQTAVEAIEAAEGEVVYYDLQGVRVENPSNGIYIMIKNGKALKVSVK